MFRGFFDNNKGTDPEVDVAHRRAFIERMERKLEFKKSLTNDNYADDRYLIR